MELQFIKDDHERWVSEFEAGADFNLHIERKTGGTVTLYQRTTGGGYDVVDDFEVMRHQPVIDYDCTALIYPKFIKVVCSSEPSYAEVVTNGEVTEIKSQSKEVEITANGVTEIAPDNGFGYLSGVKVNVNVPQSGGGESGGGDAPSKSSWRYLDVTGVNEYMFSQMLKRFAATCVVKVSGVSHIVVALVTVAGMPEGAETKAISIDMQTRIKDQGTGFAIMSYDDYFKQDAGGISAWEYLFINNGAVEITEEEFYAL